MTLDCPALPVKITLNLMDKYVPRPAILDSLPDIPFPFRRDFHHFKSSYIVSPGQLCNDLLHKLLVAVRLARARIYLRFRAPNPVIPGNAWSRS
jgi:hypothetical protein